MTAWLIASTSSLRLLVSSVQLLAPRRNRFDRRAEGGTATGRGLGKEQRPLRLSKVLAALAECGV